MICPRSPRQKKEEATLEWQGGLTTSLPCAPTGGPLRSWLECKATHSFRQGWWSGKCFSLSGEHSGSFSMPHPMTLQFPSLGNSPKRNKSTCPHKGLQHTTVLLVIVKNGKQPKCPPTRERINCGITPECQITRRQRQQQNYNLLIDTHHGEISEHQADRNKPDSKKNILYGSLCMKPKNGPN